MRTIRLTIEYDGRAYVGWQRQRNGVSVQEELERSLAQVLQQGTKVVGAGRTDSGVHARGQVVHFKTRNLMPVRQIRKGLNAVLPRDIVVREAEEVEAGFHARHSAKERAYRYYVSTVPTALNRERCWVVFPKLHVSPMRECAEFVKGAHDFASFAKKGSVRDSSMCSVKSARWIRQGPLLVFEIRANRFLHGMVRSLVGTMVEVGRGRRTVDEFKRVLDARDRKLAGPAAPAQGLVLEEVLY